MESKRTKEMAAYLRNVGYIVLKREDIMECPKTDCTLWTFITQAQLGRDSEGRLL